MDRRRLEKLVAGVEKISWSATPDSDVAASVTRVLLEKALEDEAGDSLQSLLVAIGSSSD